MRTGVVHACFVWIHVFVDLGKCSGNLALHKPAWTSSKSSNWGVPSAAVDGHISTTNNTVCIHTTDEDPSPWLVVDLLDQYIVTNVFIYNRQDCCQFRLHDFVIEMFDTNPVHCNSAQGRMCKNFTGTFGLSGRLDCVSPVEGRYIRVWKPTKTVNSDSLNMCELKVFGQKKGCGPSSIVPVKGKRLDSTNVVSHTTESRLACVTECEVIGGCFGINYNTQNGMCELLPRPETSNTVTVDEDWDYCGHGLC